MKIIQIVVGHRQSDQGAVNIESGITEFEFNNNLAQYIKSIASSIVGIKVEITIRQDVKKGYIYLPADINEKDPDYIISLHGNAFNTEVSGTETLHHYNSRRGKAMAQILQKHKVNYLQLPDRGIHPRRVRKEKPEGYENIPTNGGHLLKYTDAPCVISEPIFIDNNSDLLKATSDIDGLAQAYVNAIIEIVQRV